MKRIKGDGPYTVRVFYDNREIATHRDEPTRESARKVARAELLGHAGRSLTQGVQTRYLSTITDRHQAVRTTFAIRGKKRVVAL